MIIAKIGLGETDKITSGVKKDIHTIRMWQMYTLYAIVILPYCFVCVMACQLFYEFYIFMLQHFFRASLYLYP
jgi:hypothetical protein